MRRKSAIWAIMLCLPALGLVMYVHSPKTTPPAMEAGDRLPELETLIAEQEAVAARAVAHYFPATEGRIDDLDSDVVSILRQLPGSVNVEVAVRADTATDRIVHLRDWHSVPADLYAIDMKNALGREPIGAEIDRLHKELVLKAEVVQIEQMALLRCLARHHGLKRIYSEGLTTDGLQNYLTQVGVLGQMERESVSSLRRQLADVKGLLLTMETQGRTETDRYKQAQEIQRQVAGMIYDHKARLVELGSPGRLLITREIEEVLPLDDDELLERAKPVTPDGKIRLDPARLKARQDAIVKAVLDRGGFGVIVLGGAHDLSDSVRRLGQGRCEYIRVTTKRFREIGD